MKVEGEINRLFPTPVVFVANMKKGVFTCDAPLGHSFLLWGIHIGVDIMPLFSVGIEERKFLTSRERQTVVVVFRVNKHQPAVAVEEFEEFPRYQSAQACGSRFDLTYDRYCWDWSSIDS